MTFKNPQQFFKDILSSGNKIDILTREEFINFFHSEILENRYKIIDCFLPFLIDKEPELCFTLIYDLKKYEDKTLALLKRIIGTYNLSKKELTYILYNLPKGNEILLSALENHNISYSNNNLLLTLILNDLNHNEDLLSFFKNNKNLSIRFSFMNNIALKRPELFSSIFPNIIENIFYIDENNKKEYISMDNLSNLACNLSKTSQNKEIYEQLKSFLYKTYPKNNIARNLIREKNEKLLLEDLDNLYQTSFDYNIEILKKYENYLSKDIIGNLKKNYELFKRTPYHLQNIYTYNLDKNLANLMNKYLSLSKNKTIKFIGKGTTAACYRIGDFVIKFILSKHTYNATPRLYLINRVLYEELVKDDYGKCLAGLEVQKYLAKKLSYLDLTAISKYQKLLREEGFYISDSLIKSNFRFLDSYKDADCPDPELLPDCFKKKPLVCIDRDSFEKIKKII